jgi:hypothetical protein
MVLMEVKIIEILKLLLKEIKLKKLKLIQNHLLFHKIVLMLIKKVIFQRKMQIIQFQQELHQLKVFMKLQIHH